MTTEVILAPVQVQMSAGQAGSDAEVIALWLHGRSPHTQRAYVHDVGRFLAFVARPLAQVKLRDLQSFSASLVGLADGSRARCLAAVKSLLTFAQKIGFIPLNVGAALELPSSKDTLAEKILPEDDVLGMIRTERKPRNHALLRLLYVAGVRVSEVCGLNWRDVQPVGDDTAQVYGKGGKTRAHCAGCRSRRRRRSGSLAALAEACCVGLPED